MVDLSEPRDTALRNDTAALREGSESLGRRDDLVVEPLTDLGHLTLDVPGANRRKVSDG